MKKKLFRKCLHYSFWDRTTTNNNASELEELYWTRILAMISNASNLDPNVGDRHGWTPLHLAVSAYPDALIPIRDFLGKTKRIIFSLAF